MKIENDEPIPADIVLLAAQTEANLDSVQNLMGLAAIDTAQLDGETNLKQKYALPETSGFITPEKLLANMSGTLRCEPPNERLDTFTGQLFLDKADGGSALSIKAPQSVLRGCTLRNTIAGYGLVVNCGPECKIQKNLDRKPLKKLSQVGLPSPHPREV